MANKTTFVVQSFIMRRGQLVPGAKDVSPTQNGAVKRATALATRFLGAAAITVVADDDTGEVSFITIVETFGQVPDDFAASL